MRAAARGGCAAAVRSRAPCCAGRLSAGLVWFFNLDGQGVQILTKQVCAVAPRAAAGALSLTRGTPTQASVPLQRRVGAPVALPHGSAVAPSVEEMRAAAVLDSKEEPLSPASSSKKKKKHHHRKADS